MGAKRKCGEGSKGENLRGKGGKRRIDMSVRWRNGDGNKGAQEITHELTKEQFKKGDKNNNGIGGDGIDRHRVCKRS